MTGLDDFVQDAPWTEDDDVFAAVEIENPIEGVRLNRLSGHGDSRGELTVLMSDRYDPTWRTPHVYLVTAAARSVRAWVFHRFQSDRLAFTAGTFRVVLFDMRDDSPTKGVLNVLEVGAANPVLLTIPPFVVHGVQNRGEAPAQFINMPTRAYDPALPDKSRLPAGHPAIPYIFD